MVSHERLLENILWMWNPEQQHFEVGAHILTVEVEDIYFWTVFFYDAESCRNPGSAPGF